MSVDSIASPTPPLASVVPAYVYTQYADDANITAFFSAVNTLAGGYLSWMTNTPLALYTSPTISGPLLDWIGQGIYGITRPIISTLSTQYTAAALDGVPLDTIAIDGSSFSSSGSAFPANDDYYKRVITWQTYIGDGRIFNAMVLRKRIARFLYGINGTDITASQSQAVSVASTGAKTYTIIVPSAANPASTYFQDLFNTGSLGYPFMQTATVNIV
jgi:hypothetical protein